MTRTSDTTASPEAAPDANERRGRPTALERAFELARSGDCHSVQEIRERLRAEGHVESQVTGPSLVRQLRDLLPRKPD